MKKLLGLVAVVLVLSFAPASVSWAAPGQHHEQQKKEQQKKAVKHPNHQNAKVKTPPNHTRSQIKSNGQQTKGQAKAHVNAPANHPRGKIKSDGHQSRKIAFEKIKPPENRERHNMHKHASRLGQPRSGHQDHPTDHRFIHRHSSRQHWPDSDAWHRRFRDWSWFGSHRAHNFDACYDRHDRPMYISYEPLEDNYLYLLESRYGECHYRERHHRHGTYGWCYYWFGGGNVIAFFVGDDGNSRTFIWQRAEAEGQAVALGILTPDLQLVYGRYDDAMPPELAAGYAQDVLWATVDDET